MIRGFFADSELASQEPAALLPKCGACGLHLGCRSPKMKVAGQGKKRILVVGEAPGEEEDKTGKPFVGPAGRLLQNSLSEAGIDLFRDCWVTNALVCRPPGNKIPEKTKSVDYCRPNLINTLRALRPDVTLLLGGTPVRSLIGHLRGGDPGGVMRWVGWQIPDQVFNTWVCPTYHPSFVLRQDRDPLPKKFFVRHLQAVTRLSSRPWEDVPDFSSSVRVELDAGRAARALRAFRDAKALAFDYETNMLKPDGGDARIVSCAFSDGKRTIAYPWHGEVIAATRELLDLPVPKIASNLKFEERWTIKEFGRGVNGWHGGWDTMLAAHVLDNRVSEGKKGKGTTSVKFQAFVLLGQPDWDRKVTKYLKSDGPSLPNRINEVSLTDLLLYNGLDALLEYKVARIQRGLFSKE